MGFNMLARGSKAFENPNLNFEITDKKSFIKALSYFKQYPDSTVELKIVGRTIGVLQKSEQVADLNSVEFLGIGFTEEQLLSSLNSSNDVFIFGSGIVIKKQSESEESTPSDSNNHAKQNVELAANDTEFKGVKIEILPELVDEVLAREAINNTVTSPKSELVPDFIEAISSVFLDQFNPKDYNKQTLILCPNSLQFDLLFTPMDQTTDASLPLIFEDQFNASKLESVSTNNKGEFFLVRKVGGRKPQKIGRLSVIKKI